MKPAYIQGRIKTLETITGSGIRVVYHTRKGVHYFQFMIDKQTLKTVCTYRKARIFAEGIATGIGLGAPCRFGK